MSRQIIIYLRTGTFTLYIGHTGRANGVYTSTNNLETLTTLITVHPNPFSERVTVNIDMPKSREVQIDLLGINGQLIRQLIPNQNIQQQQLVIDLPELSAGSYLLRIRVDGEQVVKQLVKK